MDDSAPKQNSSPRWKLLASMLGAPVALWVLAALTGVLDEAFDGVLASLLLILLVAAFLIWLLFLGRVPRAGKAAGLGLIVLFVALFRYDGLTGAFFPRFVLRGAKSPATELPQLAGKMAAAGEQLETARPENYPRFLGPEMSNWVTGQLLAEGWYEEPPEELWRIGMGEGWGSFSVAGGFAFTMEQRGDKEVLVCYELLTGDAVWVHSEDVRFEEGMGGDGPRSTPTVADGKVFSLGATGIFNCHEARTGELLWGKNVLAEAGQQVPMWAKSCSPLVVGDRVIITLGDRTKEGIAAYSVADGERIWIGGDDGSSYASPVLATLAGQEQVLAILKKGVHGLSIDDGSVLWSFPIGNEQGNCASPQVIGDMVLTSKGYGYGSHLIEVIKTDAGFAAEELWYNNGLKSKFADMVVQGDYAYGLNEGEMVCISLEDGEREWRGKKLGHGQMIGVGGHIIVQSEKGKIYVLQASPDDQQIESEFAALSSKTWNHPILAGRILLVRNDREAVAFQYPARAAAVTAAGTPPEKP